MLSCHSCCNASQQESTHRMLYSGCRSPNKQHTETSLCNHYDADGQASTIWCMHAAAVCIHTGTHACHHLSPNHPRLHAVHDSAGLLLCSMHAQQHMLQPHIAHPHNAAAACAPLPLKPSRFPRMSQPMSDAPRHKGCNRWLAACHTIATQPKPVSDYYWYAHHTTKARLSRLLPIPSSIAGG
jgi:hypothetical protein